MCRDYYQNKQAVLENKIIDSQGRTWHRMGDTGYFDEVGNFWIVGRVHSTIYRANTLVHPQLVEQAACSADKNIGRVAAVGIPDTVLGERVILVTEGNRSLEVQAEIRAKLQEAGQQIDEIQCLDTPLPVDPRHNSKINYQQLRTRLMSKRNRS